MSLGIEPLGTNAALSNNLMSMFNFCNPFDTVLPDVSSDLSDTSSQQFLWGLFSDILTESSAFKSAWTINSNVYLGN